MRYASIDCTATELNWPDGCSWFNKPWRGSISFIHSRPFNCCRVPCVFSPFLLCIHWTGIRPLESAPLDDLCCRVSLLLFCRKGKRDRLGALSEIAGYSLVEYCTIRGSLMLKTLRWEWRKNSTQQLDILMTEDELTPRASVVPELFCWKMTD